MGTRIFRCFGALAPTVFCALVLALISSTASAQSGVDNSTGTGVFQTEGDAQRTGTICWLTPANGGPAIATPGPINPNPNKLDGNGCPTVSPAGNSATWTLINYGGATDDWS